MLTRWIKGYRGYVEQLEGHPPAGAVRRVGRVYDPVYVSPLSNDSEWPTASDVRAEQKRFASEKPTSGWCEAGLWHVDEGRCWIPDGSLELQVRLLVVSHCGVGGHRGRKATVHTVRSRYSWTNLEQDATEFAEQCLLCLMTAGGFRIPPVSYTHLTLPTILLV